MNRLTPSILAGGCIACQKNSINHFGALSETVKKASFIASIYLMQFAAMVNKRCHQVWSATKTVGHFAQTSATATYRSALAILKFSGGILQKIAFVTSSVFGKIASISKTSALTAGRVSLNFCNKTAHLVHGLGVATLNSIKHVGTQFASGVSKVTTVAGVGIAKSAEFLAKGCSVVKNEAAVGLRSLGQVISTHRKETAILSCSIAIGLAAAYGAKVAFNHFHAHPVKNNPKPVEKSKTV